MSFKARRRAEHTARLTTQLNRERGASRALGRGPRAPRAPRTDGSNLAATVRLRATPLTRGAPAFGRAAGVGRPAVAPARPLVARWTTNAGGRLVMTWSPVPEVEVAPVISLSGRDRAPAAPAGRLGLGRVS